MRTHIHHLQLIPPVIHASKQRFSKPPRLIEKATTRPEEVITQIFEETSLDELQEYFLHNWLRVALINTNSPYSSSNDREMLCEFYDQLLLFAKALFFSSIYPRTYNFKELNKNLEVNPYTTVCTFFEQFSIEYIRRELAEFLEAGIGYEGKYPNGFTPWQVLLTYNNIQCLTEAAYQRYINQRMN